MLKWDIVKDNVTGLLPHRIIISDIALALYTCKCHNCGELIKHSLFTQRHDKDRHPTLRIQKTQSLYHIRHHRRRSTI